MSQYLLLPFRRQMLLCGYRSEPYRAYWGYPHCGIDLSARQCGAEAEDTVYASGTGTVLAAGKDNTLGYGVAVLYRECISRTGQTADLAVRYLHLKTCCVKAGQAVTAATALGGEGKEGTADYHLHLECDTDTLYPLFTPQVKSGHTFWKKGKDTTGNPSLWLWRGGERETVPPTYHPAWLNPEDLDFPAVPQTPRERLLSLARQMTTELEGSTWQADTPTKSA